MTTNPTITGLDLLNEAPHGAYAVNLAQTIRFWKAAAERITGHKAGKVTGRPCYGIVQNCLPDGEAPMCRDGCPFLQAIRENRLPPVYERNRNTPRAGDSRGYLGSCRIRSR